MSIQSGKKFIAPGAWFSMVYPNHWNEFEDSASTFLFYDPVKWNGNFRISAYKDVKHANSPCFGKDILQQELKENDAAVQITIGRFDCAYSKEMFQDDDKCYVNHHWIIDGGYIVFECSFTVLKGSDITDAKQVIESLDIREEGKKYPAEIIPIRLSEINQVDEAYEWTVSTLKKQLKKDFQGIEYDLPKLQSLIDSDAFTPKQREAWISVGITVCVILTNEIDGFEWMTLVDGNRETPVLQYQQGSTVVDPMKLTWSNVKAGKTVDIVASYKTVVEHL